MCWKSFLSLHDFWVRKCKNQYFEENKRFECSFYHIQVPVIAKIVREYDQEIPQSQAADNPMAPRGRATQPSRDTRKTNEAKQR